jgi:dTDP-4-amino-4,6-dideoxygalactose transaminase
MLPLTRPWMDGAEADAAADALRRLSLIGDGPCGRESEDALGRLLDGARPLLMNSCTSALEAAVSLAGVRAGDDVVLPSFTFVSCANAIVRVGARPVFADIDPVTLNINPDAIARAITPRTRAIIVVHYGGRACDMDRILEIGRHAGALVIEDAAHALGAGWNDRMLGTVGGFGCFSFHGTKDVVCGEGGALVCSREQDRKLAEVLREKGTNRAAFLRGEVDKYSWVAEGSSYVASDLLAAILRVQLSRLPAILARKRALAAKLSAALAAIGDRVILPREWPGIRSSWHLYPILVPAAVRDQILTALHAENIGAAFHYVPLHDSPYARQHFGGATGMLPVTEAVSASLVRLPLFAAMSDDDLDDVTDATLKVIQAFVAPGSLPLLPRS